MSQAPMASQWAEQWAVHHTAFPADRIQRLEAAVFMARSVTVPSAGAD
jgi:hypothetical protein